MVQVLPKTRKEWSRAMNASARSGQWKKALDLIAEMPRRKISPSVVDYNTVIAACKKGRRWDMGIRMLREMKAVKVIPDVITYNTAISGCARSKQWEIAMKLLEEMQSEGLRPDVISYNACITALEKGSQWKKAVELLKQMKIQGLKPDVISYSSAISACEKGRNGTLALNLLEEMKRCNVEPNDYSYNASISASGNEGRFEQAIQLLKEMGPRADVISYNAVISACEKSGKWQKALDLLLQMEDRGLCPDVITFNTCISACDKGFQWEHAVELLNQMEGRGLKPDVISYSSAISACEKGRKWELAVELLNQMRRICIHPNVITYSSAILACAKCDKPEFARDLFLKMDVERDLVCYNAVIFSCEKDWPMAMKFFKEMEEGSIEPDYCTYVTLMQILVGNSQIDEAFLLLERVHESAFLQESYWVHYMLLELLHKVGESKRAAEVQAMIDKCGLRGKPAVVQFVADNSDMEYANGPEFSSADEALEKLFLEVSEKTNYHPVLEALPFDFNQHAPYEKKVKSLKYHAEKKALARLLLTNESELTMRVNINVCADCHSFLTHASQLLGRPIHVREHHKEHIFVKGICSCGC